MSDLITELINNNHIKQKVMKKMIYFFGIAISLALVLNACQKQQNEIEAQDSVLKAKMAKIEICHLNGNGDYNNIEINENALDAHLAHGDKFVNSPEGSYTFRKVIDRGVNGIITGDYIVEISADDVNGDFTGTGIRYDIPNGGNAYVNITGNVDDTGVMTFLMEQWLNDPDKTGTPQNYWTIDGTVEMCDGISEIHWVSGKEGVHVFILLED